MESFKKMDDVEKQPLVGAKGSLSTDGMGSPKSQMPGNGGKKPQTLIAGACFCLASGSMVSAYRCLALLCFDVVKVSRGVQPCMAHKPSVLYQPSWGGQETHIIVAFIRMKDAMARPGQNSREF